MGRRLLERQQRRRLARRPSGDPNTRGEGPDCSGLTFKAWYERGETVIRGSATTSWLQNVHGP